MKKYCVKIFLYENTFHPVTKKPEYRIRHLHTLRKDLTWSEAKEMRRNIRGAFIFPYHEETNVIE